MVLLVICIDGDGIFVTVASFLVFFFFSPLRFLFNIFIKHSRALHNAHGKYNLESLVFAARIIEIDT